MLTTSSANRNVCKYVGVACKDFSRFQDSRIRNSKLATIISGSCVYSLQVDGPVDHIKEEKGEWKESAGIEIDTLGRRGDDGLRRRWLFAGFALRLEVTLDLHRLAVAVKVGELKVPRQRAHDAEVVGTKVRLGGADLLAASFYYLVENTA